MSVQNRTHTDPRFTIGGILCLLGVVIAFAGIADSSDELSSGVGAVIGGFLTLLGVILIAGARSADR